MELLAKARASTPPARTRILVVDDHPIIRRGLTALLNQEPDLTVCAEAQGSREALRGVEEQRPDLVIIDLAIDGAGLGGLELIKSLKTARPELPILVFTMHDESYYAERALRAGAAGYVMKQAEPEVILAAVRQVVRGEVALSQRMVARFLYNAVGRSKPRSAIELLSDREMEVFKALGQGRTTRQIARDLHVSTKTVQSHRANIKCKLKIGDGPELLQHAIRWVHAEEGVQSSPPEPAGPRLAGVPGREASPRGAASPSTPGPLASSIRQGLVG